MREETLFRIKTNVQGVLMVVGAIAVVAMLIFLISAISIGIYREVTGRVMLGSDVQIKVMVTGSDIFYDLDKSQVYRFQDGSWVATNEIVVFHEIPQGDDNRR